MSSLPRLLCLMGSGEMSPGMAQVHADLLRRVGGRSAPAALLDTSYGFQENAEELTAKARRFFETRLHHPIEVASLLSFDEANPVVTERAYRLLADAAYIFAGPGSPSYTIRHWRPSRVPELIARRLATGGCVTLASAAAIAVGRLALPVYEIYKVGEPPHWIEGLDLLRPAGLDVAVITHYDNAEGGTHDTRYCYMGARRLARLEAQLPSEISILGIAEHTAAIVDLDARTLEVRGRGFVAIRRQGTERRVAAGDTVPLEALALGGPSPSRDPGVMHEPLRSAGKERDAISEEERIQAELRQAIEKVVEVALRLRDEARQERRYSEADRLRDALLDLGIEVRDTPVGSEWTLKDRGR
jgi:cyanophycinase-like exopeptidase